MAVFIKIAMFFGHRYFAINYYIFYLKIVPGGEITYYRNYSQRSQYFLF
jgi:hypothetical protein